MFLLLLAGPPCPQLDKSDYCLSCCSVAQVVLKKTYLCNDVYVYVCVGVYVYASVSLRNQSVGQAPVNRQSIPEKRQSSTSQCGNAISVEVILA